MKNTKIKRINLLWLFVFTAPIFMLLAINLSSTPQIEFSILIAASLLYITLAMIDHYLEKNFSFEIMIEYVLIAVLALLVFYTIIF